MKTQSSTTKCHPSQVTKGTATQTPSADDAPSPAGKTPQLQQSPSPDTPTRSAQPQSHRSSEPLRRPTTKAADPRRADPRPQAPPHQPPQHHLVSSFLRGKLWQRTRAPRHGRTRRQWLHHDVDPSTLGERHKGLEEEVGRSVDHRGRRAASAIREVVGREHHQVAIVLGRGHVVVPAVRTPSVLESAKAS